nr:hypothetical protein [uncultured Lacinutrix sp.]
MKNIITLFTILIISINSFAQCDKLVHIKYDKFDKDTTYKSTYLLQNSYKTIELSFSYISGVSYGHLSVSLFGLIDLNDPYADKNNGWVYPGNNGYIQFLFENGETGKLENAKENGDKFFSTGFWRNNYDKRSGYRLELLNKLQTLNLESLRYHTSNGNFDFDLTTKQQSDLKKIFKCVYPW